MRGKLAALGALALLAGCAQPPSSGGIGFVTIAGTPFYLIGKVPTCVVSAALAAPLAGLQGLAASRPEDDIRPGLEAGVDQNCGPPYYLPPGPAPVQVVQQAAPQPVSR